MEISFGPQKANILFDSKQGRALDNLKVAQIQDGFRLGTFYTALIHTFRKVHGSSQEWESIEPDVFGKVIHTVHDVFKIDFRLLQTIGIRGFQSEILLSDAVDPVRNLVTINLAQNMKEKERSCSISIVNSTFREDPIVYLLKIMRTVCWDYYEPSIIVKLREENKKEIVFPALRTILTNLKAIKSDIGGEKRPVYIINQFDEEKTLRISLQNPPDYDQVNFEIRNLFLNMSCSYQYRSGEDIFSITSACFKSEPLGALLNTFDDLVRISMFARHVG